MKIRVKFTIYSIVIFIFVILIVGTTLGFYFYNISKSQILSYLFSSSRARAEHVITFLNDKKETSDILAAASVYRDFLKESHDSVQYSAIKTKIDKRLARTMDIDKSILELYILDKSGQVVASSDEEEVGEDRANDSYFIQGQKEAYIKDVYYYEDFNKNVYTVSSPVIDDSGSFLGVSVLMFSVDNLYSIVSSENGMGKTEENFLIDKNQYFITPSLFLGSEVILKQKVETKNANACFSKTEVDYVKKNGYSGLRNFLGESAIIEAKDYRGVDVIGTHLFIPTTGWCFITKVDKAELLNNSGKFIVFLVVVLSLSLLLFLIVSSLIVRLITKPIVILTNATKKIQSGNFNINLDNKTNDEVGNLSRNFEIMIESVRQSRHEIDEKVKEQTKEIVEKQQDIENQQKATLNILEDIEEDKTKTDALLASIGDGVIATDVNTDVIFINKSAEDMIGWKSSEIIGKSIYDFLPIIDEKGKTIPEENRPFHVALNTKKKFVAPLQSPRYYVKRNGETFPASITVTPVIIDEKLIGAINVFHDVTHEREIDKAKTEFVSLASHQLRTPLSAINWYTEILLAGDAGKVTDEQKQYLDEVYRSNKRMVELVNSLLNVSRIDLGTFAIVPEPVDISEVSKSVLMELTPMIKEKKMKIEESYDKKVKKINVDQKLIRIIFQNLLSNAVKYTPEGGKVSVFIEKQDKDILIKVQDTGYGIPKKDQARIFEKLFRADNIRQKETDGTGLGLYIIKSILEQSGGNIYFESDDDPKGTPGTTFFVTIPLSGMKAKEGNKDLS